MDIYQQIETLICDTFPSQESAHATLACIPPQERYAVAELERALELAQILKKLNVNDSYIAAAVLFMLSPTSFASHDLPEDCDPILKIHSQLLGIHEWNPNLHKPQQADLFLKMLVATTSDLRLLLVLVALQLEKLRTIKSLTEKQQVALAQQNLWVYAPLAQRLGVFWLKAELEDSSLRYIAPEMYYDLKQRVAKKRDERSNMVEELSQQLRATMKTHQIQCEVVGRYKRFYSIYKKLEKVNYDFKRIQDLVAFRILTDSVQDCYTALGYVHELWEPKTGRFKDYIAKPKPNGYQSLHTTVFLPNKEVIEIQIRTHQMNEVAEFGVAAHWMYKTQSNVDSDESAFYNTLLKQSKAVAKGSTPPNSNNADSSTEQPKELLKIYVFTPQNDILEFRHGATPVDFAYAVHTQVGDRITGAKINGRIVKLDTFLKNGDYVEVLTSSKQEPRAEWLQFVQTSRAKNKIRHAILVREREEQKRQGWSLLDKEFKSASLNLNRLIKEGRFEQEVLKRKRQSPEMLFAEVGGGSLKTSEVLSWFVPEVPSEPEVPFRKKLPPKVNSHQRRLQIDGISDIPIRFAKCCQPQPGEPITGYITHGSGISVHHQDCEIFHKMDEARKIYITWSQEEE